MIARLSSLVTAHFVLLARSFFIILGCLAVCWGATEIRIFWQDSTIEQIASHIIGGDQFKVETLARQLPLVERIENAAYCRPTALRSATILQIRMMEIAAIANDHTQGNGDLRVLDNEIRRSLSCSPADPFLWLVLYNVKQQENGFRPDDVKYLRMSYRLGPNEGWIGIKRNNLTFSEIGRLPADFVETAITEFVGLVGSGFSEQTADILIGPAWGMRQTIFQRLKDAPDNYREQFFSALQRRGYDAVHDEIVRPDGDTPTKFPR